MRSARYRMLCDNIQSIRSKNKQKRPGYLEAEQRFRKISQCNFRKKKVAVNVAPLQVLWERNWILHIADSTVITGTRDFKKT